MDKMDKIDRLQNLSQQLRETAEAVDRVANKLYTLQSDNPDILLMLYEELNSVFTGAVLETDCLYLKIKTWMLQEE